MRPDVIIPQGWQTRYRELMGQYDLVPTWYASDPIEIPLTRNTTRRVAITLSEDFWWYALHTQCYAQGKDDQSFFSLPKAPTVDIKPLINGDPIWSSFTNAQVLMGTDLRHLDNGFLLKKSSTVTVEISRPLAQQSVEAETYYFTLIGSNLAKRGTGELPSGWRTMTRQDFESNAIIKPHLYADEATLEPDGTGWTETLINMRPFDFACERINFYALQEEDTDQLSYAPALTQIFIDDVPLHSLQSPGIPSIAWGGGVGFGTINDWDLRLPRLFRANGAIRVRMGAFPYAFTGDFENKIPNPIRVQFQGFEILDPRPED